MKLLKRLYSRSFVLFSTLCCVMCSVDALASPGIKEKTCFLYETASFLFDSCSHFALGELLSVLLCFYLSYFTLCFCLHSLCLFLTCVTTYNQTQAHTLFYLSCLFVAVQKREHLFVYIVNLPYLTS